MSAFPPPDKSRRASSFCRNAQVFRRTFFPAGTVCAAQFLSP